jgi:Flp pilus assembly protein TadB
MMITALVLGAGFGVGLWALAVWLAPPRPDLAGVLTRATTTPPPPPPPILPTSASGWAARLGRPFIGPLRALGLPSRSLAADLAVIGRPAATHLAEQATLALAGLLTPVLLQALLAVGGIWLGLQLPILAGFALAAVGFLLPDLQARAEARALRTGFRHALSAYLDLVWITLAGGAGVDSALSDTAAIGHGWAFTQLRRALQAAHLTRTSPWISLRQLGQELDIAELAELAASISLAGTEGAKVRTSLAAKAATLRTHQLTDAETEAHAATERMSLPVMLLLLGFLAFIAYPALTQVLNGL